MQYNVLEARTNFSKLIDAVDKRGRRGDCQARKAFVYDLGQ